MVSPPPEEDIRGSAVLPGWLLSVKITHQLLLAWQVQATCRPPAPEFRPASRVLPTAAAASEWTRATEGTMQAR